MGCDIHIYTEALNHKDKWVNCDHWRFDEYNQSFCPVEIYDDRDYRLFAVLAGVRNYEDVEPIHRLRGLPTDMHALTRQEAESWKLDAHSYSYFTLAELKSAEQPVLSKIIEPLESRKQEVYHLYDPEDSRPDLDVRIRIVFWFDN